MTNKTLLIFIGIALLLMFIVFILRIPNEKAIVLSVKSNTTYSAVETVVLDCKLVNRAFLRILDHTFPVSNTLFGKR